MEEENDTMKKKLLLMASAATLGFSSCKTKPPGNTNSALPKVIIEEGYNTPQHNDGYTIQRASISKDVITIVVQYSGGCKNHEFELKGSKMWLKSLPPQKGLTLEHNANGDNCREYITDTLQFDLTSAKYMGKDEDYTVIFNLSGYKEKLRYEY